MPITITQILFVAHANEVLKQFNLIMADSEGIRVLSLVLCVFFHSSGIDMISEQLHYPLISIEYKTVNKYRP